MKKRSNKILVIDYDKVIFLAYLSLMIIGLFIMLDINSVRNSMVYFYRQAMFFLLSVFVLLFTVRYMDFNNNRRLISLSLIITIILLILVLIVGVSVKGATRSFRLGFIGFQPSFLARIVLVFYFAHIIDKKRNALNSKSTKEFLKAIFPLVMVAGLTYGLILRGQHLSSIIISASTLICMLFLGGIRLRIIVLAIILGVLGGFLIIKLGADYRADRFDIYKKYSLFFRDNNQIIEGDKDYQVRESLIALTSGRLLGTGPDWGRAKHYFLPEARTDYVFTVIGEEFGFLGAIFVFGLHCLLFFKIMLIAYKQIGFYLKLVMMGLALNIFINVLVNVGVSMSILPSTGNTLPFISYSGTAIVLDSFTIGIILNISAQRKTV